MKRFLSFALSVLIAGSALAATQSYVVETCNRGGTAASPLDSFAANDEIVRKALNTSVTPNLGTGFIWGGYFSSTATAGVVALNDSGTGSTGNLQMAKNNYKAGNRAYTRFDTSPLLSTDESTNNPTKYNTPSITVDCSPTGSVAIFQYVYGPEADGMISVLIRDDVGWFKSEAKSRNTANWPGPGMNCIGWDLHMATWQAVDMVNGGGADMDECDSGGESALQYLPGTGTPHLDKIQGMGFVVESDITTVTSNSGMTNMILGKLPDSPVLPPVTATATDVNLDWNDVAGATLGYNVYRSTAAGRFGTKLNTTGALTTSSYTDTGAVTAGKQYYYTVSRIIDVTNTVESMSNEVPYPPLSTVKDWKKF